MTRIVHRAGWLLAGVLGLLVVAALTGVVHGGPLDPPAGAPASTNRTLIFQPASCAGFPIVLSTPGSYALASNITGCPADGIQISASDVSLDCNGFALIGNFTSGTGVKVPAPQTKLALVNCAFDTWFNGAVDFSLATQSRLEDLRVQINGPAPAGGQVVLGSSDTLQECTVSQSKASALGVVVTGSDSVVDGCLITGNQAQGLKTVGSNNRITNNHVNGNATGVGCAGIWVAGLGTVVEGNTAESSGAEACPFFIDGVGGTCATACATGSIITKNIAHGGGAFNFANNCGVACDVGPVGTAAASTSPWANISE